jgi:hypothetical protein
MKTWVIIDSAGARIESEVKIVLQTFRHDYLVATYTP